MNMLQRKKDGSIIVGLIPLTVDIDPSKESKGVQQTRPLSQDAGQKEISVRKRTTQPRQTTKKK